MSFARIPPSDDQHRLVHCRCLSTEPTKPLRRRRSPTRTRVRRWRRRTQHATTLSRYYPLVEQSHGTLPFHLPHPSSIAHLELHLLHTRHTRLERLLLAAKVQIRSSSALLRQRRCKRQKSQPACSGAVRLHADHALQQIPLLCLFPDDNA